MHISWHLLLFAATWTYPLFGTIDHWCSLVHSSLFRVPPPPTARATTPIILIKAGIPAVCHADHQRTLRHVSIITKHPTQIILPSTRPVSSRVPFPESPCPDCGGCSSFRLRECQALCLACFPSSFCPTSKPKSWLLVFWCSFVLFLCCSMLALSGLFPVLCLQLLRPVACSCSDLQLLSFAIQQYLTYLLLSLAAASKPSCLLLPCCFFFCFRDVKRSVFFLSFHVWLLSSISCCLFLFVRTIPLLLRFGLSCVSAALSDGCKVFLHRRAPTTQSRNHRHVWSPTKIRSILVCSDASFGTDVDASPWLLGRHVSAHTLLLSVRTSQVFQLQHDWKHTWKFATRNRHAS